MALDLCQVDEGGRVVGNPVRISVAAHARLIELARTHDLSTLLRLEEYYDDVVFEPSQVLELAKELSRIDQPIPSADSADIVQEMLNVVRRSIAAGGRIEAIAD